MYKLSPPTILSTLPAFYGDKITIAFINNISVNSENVKNIAIIIKDLYNNLIYASQKEIDSNIFEQQSITFAIDTIDNFNIGDFYKVQIAYVDFNGQIGYYSSVGVIKYTSLPDVNILNLDSSVNINIATQEFIGVYKNLKDITEKLYSSYFVLKDSNNKIVFQSNEIVHNTEKDVNYEQIENISINFDYQNGEKYSLQFFITTINGLKTASPQYFITKQNTIDSVFKQADGKIEVENIEEEGYIQISFKTGSTLLTGEFILSRIQEDTKERIELKRFHVSKYNFDLEKFKDFLIETGKTYRYSLQQYQGNLFANEDVSPSIVADYEHIFLYDGEKSLKLKYNPTVETLKENVLENKIDTIGSKYPFIVRNGKLQYKEFPIGGLLSYWSDDMNYFTSGEINKTTNLTKENYQQEKDWKRSVLNWLNNGKVKLFKSPAEGMFLVRLLNISLAPENTLGRMLHSLTCTAYEVGDTTRENYLKYGLLTNNMVQQDNYNYRSIELSKSLSNINLIDKDIVYSLQIIDMKPGSKIKIKQVGQDEYINLIIGATGAYSVENVALNGLQIPEPTSSGIVHIKYIQQISNFSTIKEISFNSYIMSSLGTFGIDNQGFSNLYFLPFQKNKKYELQQLGFMNFEKRNLIILQNNADETNDDFYKDRIIDPMSVYFWKKITNNMPCFGYINNDSIVAIEQTSQTGDINIIKNYLDNLYNIKIDYILPDNTINSTIVNLDNRINYSLKDIDFSKIQKISIGAGIKVDLGFILKEYKYFFEEEDDFKKNNIVNDFLLNPNENTYNEYIKLFAQ